jgi:hypothetical protein
MSLHCIECNESASAFLKHVFSNDSIVLLHMRIFDHKMRMLLQMLMDILYGNEPGLNVKET